MKDQERKAVRLATTGRVDVHSFTMNVDPPFDLKDAHGTVEGDSGIWTVDVDDGGAWCDCPFGENQPGRSHSHTRALELMATELGRKAIDQGGRDER